MGGHQHEQRRQGVEAGEGLLERDARASALMDPATTRTGTDSRTMRRRPSVEDSPTRQRAGASDATTRTAPTVGETTGIPSRSVARNRAGSVEHVAERRDERGGHVVEVPAVADRPRRSGRARRRARRPSRARRRRSTRWPSTAGRSSPASPSPTAMALATTASASEMPRVSSIEASDVLAEHGLAPQRPAERAGVDRRRDPVAEGAEDVAPQPDGGRDQHEQARVLCERAGDRPRGRRRPRGWSIEFSPSATRLCRAPAASGPRSARNRALGGKSHRIGAVVSRGSRGGYPSERRQSATP